VAAVVAVVVSVKVEGVVRLTPKKIPPSIIKVSNL